ncbi:MAG: peptidase family C78-domain-containing protein [Piptocephalis tieghemiana]|nr:MAG: peptidase family C78-domain-containing protein [Piptocephalis tieghemiana]
MSTQLFRTKRREDWSWGCGYRNAQILLSAMASHPDIKDRLALPEMTITHLQETLQGAWKQGFDVAGAQQLGWKILGQKKWIGATEMYTILCGLGIKSTVVDFHRPTSSLTRQHTLLLDWVFEYFTGDTGREQPSQDDEFLPGVVKTEKLPLYFQHQGHSRTIIGVEVSKEKKRSLLLMDPSCPFPSANQEPSSFLSRVRCGIYHLARHRQYQVVRVDPKGEVGKEHQIIRSIRIPS